MPPLNRTAIEQVVLERSYNSSHFVWLLGKFEFFQTLSGWTFAYIRKNSTVLIALDPISPVTPKANLAEAFAEFSRSVPADRYAWVGVLDHTVESVAQLPWQGIVIGREPWISLPGHAASGKSARGVKSARNQAIRAGLFVEDWTGIGDQPQRLNIIADLYARWKNSTFVHLEGFLQATNHKQYSLFRKYFVVRSEEKIFGFLVASPVKQRNGYYIEDLILSAGSPRGSSELLVTTALEKLRDAGAMEASLGLVPLTDLAVHADRPPSPAMANLFGVLKQFLRLFYNSEGLMLYRKRYRPTRWENSYILLMRADGTSPTLRDWLHCTISLIGAHRPVPQLRLEAIKETFLRPLLRHPFSLFFLSVNVLTFWLINHGHSLPGWALEEYGFHASASLTEWLKRTVCSDFLFLDGVHFYVVNTAFIFVLWSLEKLYPKRLLALIILATVFLDDFLDFILIKKPLDYFHPKIFSTLVEYHDVGPSLICLTLVGMWVYSLRRWREPTFVLLFLATVLGVSFTSAHLHHFFLNINHVMFLGIGYLIAHVKQEFDRRHSQKMANRPSAQPKIR